MLRLLSNWNIIMQQQYMFLFNWKFICTFISFSKQMDFKCSQAIRHRRIPTAEPWTLITCYVMLHVHQPWYPHVMLCHMFISCGYPHVMLCHMFINCEYPHVMLCHLFINYGYPHVMLCYMFINYGYPMMAIRISDWL